MGRSGGVVLASDGGGDVVAGDGQGADDQLRKSKWTYCHARLRICEEAVSPPQTVASPRLHIAPCFASCRVSSTHPTHERRQKNHPLL